MIVRKISKMISGLGYCSEITTVITQNYNLGWQPFYSDFGFRILFI